ncbi:MAG: DUF3990 domain-containing protein [Bacteroidales bacterium]|nr:DUF3990 domain-containing protein [Bacteroidales bacterium]
MMDLYHGSEKIVRVPAFGVGNVHNDYGLGFYCTQDVGLAKEWACSDENSGFANHYLLNDTGLTCLDLNGSDYNILNWLAVLLENRRFDLSTPIAARAKKYLLENFLPSYKGFDLIKGYRADDSYFAFSRAFLSNTITLEQLRRAMALGNLGEQVVLKSPQAFEAISFVEAIAADSLLYYGRKLNRERTARNEFRAILSEAPSGSEIYISTIVNEKWTNGDTRL